VGLTRRRGQELENGLLEAANAEPVEGGLIGDRVTVDVVIVRRAVERGDIDPTRATPRVAGRRATRSGTRGS
jgi:hypothetical protein